MHRVFNRLLTQLVAITLLTAGFAGTTALAADDASGGPSRGTV